MVRTHIAALLCSTAWCLPACTPDFVDRDCYSDRDCPAKHICTDHVCTGVQEIDAGVEDLGVDLDLGVGDALPGPPIVDLCDDPAHAGESWVLVWDRDGMPVGRDRAVMDYSPLSREVIMFGGVTRGGPVPVDLWGWNGTRWREKPVTAYTPHCDHVMAQDRYGNLVVFGGRTSSTDMNTLLDETWIFDGGDLRKLEPKNKPRARMFASMAYDALRGRTVLFGGFDSAKVGFDDTWEWDGDDWSSVDTATKPPARGDHMMAFDSARGLTFMYGGSANERVKGDLWVYDGINWSPFSTTGTPPARGGGRMTYDPMRAILIVHGGTTSAITKETWILEDTTWRKLDPPEAMHVASNPAMAYDAASGRTINFSGWDYGGHPAHTWQYCPR